MLWGRVIVALPKASLPPSATLVVPRSTFMFGAGVAVTVMLNAWAASGAMPLEHEIVPVNTPTAAGVPEIAPVVALRVNPPGKAPALTLHVNVAGVPVAVQVWL